ncbi:magnesium transporter CorA family protein [Nocardia sp. 348MFTsu5.1]|uniref:magnesium transporter CorA family protein n=1 Tax=Nocardia sp. 348MFTsu5.1 TaxID=1172185 RepID=UPI00037AB551
MIEKVRGRIWRNGKLQDDFDIGSLSDCLADDTTLAWADLVNPSHEALCQLADELGLNTWAVEDALAEAERVKAVNYPHHKFITVYAVDMHADPTRSTNGALQTHRISMFIKDNVLITVRLSDAFDMNLVTERWDTLDEQHHGIGALVHGLLDVVVDGHFDAVQSLDDSIEDIETLLFDDNKNSRDLQRRTYRVRKNLVQLRRVVLPMREVVNLIQRNRLENHSNPALDANFTDLYDHVLRASEWTESLRDMVTTLFETNLSLQDARLNTVMKKLTGWAAIIAVPTAVTGFFGQNVRFPGFGTTFGLSLSVGLIVATVAILYFMFRSRDWL